MGNTTIRMMLIVLIIDISYRAANDVHMSIVVRTPLGRGRTPDRVGTGLYTQSSIASTHVVVIVYMYRTQGEIRRSILCYSAPLAFQQSLSPPPLVSGFSCMTCL